MPAFPVRACALLLSRAHASRYLHIGVVLLVTAGHLAVESHSVKKKKHKEILPFATTGMKLKDIMLSEIHETKPK